MSINFADFSVFADLYNDTGEKWGVAGADASDASEASETDCDDALKDYYDAYCSYLVSRKYTTDVIKTYRKNAIIDFYIAEKKFDDSADSVRKELDAYYIQNIKDTFHKKLDPPPCFFHEVRTAQKNEEREIATDDVAQHYISLKHRYKAIYDEMTNATTAATGAMEHNTNENHNLQSDCDEEESHYENDYYDEYYNMYDSDCYSDYDYHSDGYSDDCDFNE
jgi:hypothetical protein